MTPQELLRQLVSIPSPSGEEAAVADFAQGLLAEWGLAPQRVGHNVWCEVGKGAPRLLMATHLDTVKPCAGWSEDPWSPVWRHGRLSGLGANDAKGCATAMMLAARALKDRSLEGRVVVALCAEEETGGPGGIRSLLPHLGAFDGALVGEPTNLQPCLAQRGMLLLDCVARGESAHVAHAALAENAIHKAARDIARLAAMTFEPHPLLGATRAQVTAVKGGLALNQVPDACSFSVDLRTTPNLDHAELSERIARELESEVSVRSDRYLPKATDAAHPVAQAALMASGKAAHRGSATTSDWAHLGALPAVKIGPGDTHRSHRPDEFITEAELLAGVAFYTQVAQTFFSLCAKGVAHAH